MKATVRMYNVGFGDSFLLTVEQGRRTWRMLVDCGVHSQGVGEHRLDDIVADIVETVTGPDGVPRLDVVVASHRHQDHIAGFDNDRWQDVEVGEVWLPWVENPDDPVATRLRERQQLAAQALHLDLSAQGPEFGDFVLNSLTNEGAMWTLREGFAGSPKRRYVFSSGTRQLALGLRGGSVCFLGPPRDRTDISAMEPPAAERWLNGSSLPLSTGDGGTLFPAYSLAPTAFAKAHPHLKTAPDVLSGLGTEPVDKLAAAAWLERSINNTSVVFLLKLGEAVLLFPGDAQWGSWRPNLADAEIRALLARTTFYKVSHHGSHNGTPVSLGREVLPEKVTSLLSVRSIERWPEIPKNELVESLNERARRVVATTDAGPRRGVRRGPDGRWLELTVPTGISA